MEKIKAKIIASLFFMVISFGLNFSIKYVFYLRQDYNYWFYYASVLPIKDEFMVGEDLRFVSNSVFYRDSHVLWNDTLRCKDDALEDFSFYSNYRSENLNAVGLGMDAKPTEKYWFYQGKIPNKLSVCYLVSVIRIELPFGISKIQEITGPEFVITPYTDEITLPH